jgi:mannose-6-phosphate isomerase-like protein (cupin superfamily)
MDEAREKDPTGLLRWDIAQGSMMANHTEGTIMARTGMKAAAPPKKVMTRAKQVDVRRSAVPPPRTKAKPQHKFVASHLGPDAFKADGLRTYAHYRDLGIKDATRGMALAHVIRFTGKCDPKVVSKRHTHECEFQMIYVLKGTIKTEIEGHGVHTMNAGDSWLQPQSIVHKVLDYSDGCEVLEIVLPADFKTVELEK